MNTVVTLSARVTAGLLRVYLKLVSSFLTPLVIGPADQRWLQDDGDFARFRKQQRQEAPAIYALWIADHINLLALGYVSRQFRDIASEFHFFVDDSFGGQIMRDALKDIGAPSITISQSEPAQRLKLLRYFMEQRPSAFLAVDGRGPYFHIGSGLPNLATSLKATIIPCCVLSKPRCTLTKGQARVEIPLPGSTVLAVIGHPLRLATESVGATAAERATAIKNALGDVRSRAAKELGMSY